MKPVFIPLKTEHYEAFKSGKKTRELRIYGPRWNEGACIPGRAVTLSKGYGKANRLSGTIKYCAVKYLGELTPEEQADFLACYGYENRHALIAVIGVDL